MSLPALRQSPHPRRDAAGARGVRRKKLGGVWRIEGLRTRSTRGKLRDLSRSLCNLGGKPLKQANVPLVDARDRRLKLDDPYLEFGGPVAIVRPLYDAALQY
jgi:hypothetical protein